MDEPGDRDELTIVLLCLCSSNISNHLDMEALRQWLRESGMVDITLRGNLLCSPAEKALLEKFLKGNNSYIRGRKIGSLIVAACSPKQHELTFRQLAEKNGINPARVQMANIREQCAWVTQDKAEATAKAIRLLDAALRRGREAEDLVRPTMEVLTDVLVVGGGIAGIQTALALSRAGRQVYLVEREISIGGRVIQTEEIAPSMECSPCLLAPQLSAVRNDPLIEVLAPADIQQVTGFFGNFHVRVACRPRFVEEACIACEECFEECPVEVDHAFHHNLGKRKAIYGLFAGSVPAPVAIDKEVCLHFQDDSCNACREICPFKAVNFEQQEQERTLKVGSIVLTTGFENVASGLPDNLGHSRLENVYTTYELERLLSSNGPGDGQVLLADGGKPARVAIIHCAGSLCEGGLDYCSGVCCMNALKAGAMLRAGLPGLQVYNIHNDLVLAEPQQQEFYRRQQAEGTHFIKCRDLATVEISPSSTEGKLDLAGSDFSPLEVDLVILSTGLLPARGSRELAALMNVEVDERGFFLPDHSLLHQTGTVLDGIYAAGCAVGPCDVTTAVTRGQAAAGDILSKLIPGRKLELEMMTSVIDAELCAGCKLCIPSCPFKAIIYDEERQISVVNEALCRGCGTCTATCPSGASRARHFTGKQLMAEVGGLLNE